MSADRRAHDVALRILARALSRRLGRRVVGGWVTFPERLRELRDEAPAGDEGGGWGTRLLVSEDPPEVVGWGRL